MSSDRSVNVSRTSGSVVPRTAVRIGIDDPVEAARAELKAALFAIEDKVNVPKQAEKAAVKARLFARRKPVAAVAAAVGAAVVVGGIVWATVLSVTAPRR